MKGAFFLLEWALFCFLCFAKVYGGNCKTPFGPKFALLTSDSIPRKSSMTNRICRFARNRTEVKIIKFGLQSEFCNYLYGVQTPEDRERLAFFQSLTNEAQKQKRPLQQIPAVLHVICLGPKVPELPGLSSWIDQHRGWKVKLWSDHPCPDIHPSVEICREELFPLEELAFCFHEAENYAERVTVLRYAILLREGGICIDATRMCRSSLETLRTQWDFFCELEELKLAMRSSVVNPSSRFLASTARHPILESAKQWLVENWQEYEELFPGSDPTSAESRMVQRSEHALSIGIESAALQNARKDCVFPADTFSTKLPMEKEEWASMRSALHFSLFFVFILAALNLFLGAGVFYRYKKGRARC